MHFLAGICITCYIQKTNKKINHEFTRINPHTVEVSPPSASLIGEKADTNLFFATDLTGNTERFNQLGVLGKIHS